MVKRFLIIPIFVLLSFTQSFSQNRETIVVDKDIDLIKLQDSIYVHVSWHQLDNFGRFSSNGLVIIKRGEALLIDTPMDNKKTEILNKFLKDSLGVTLTKLVIGHFHDDCLGGLSYLQSVGVESIANIRTVNKCKEIGLPIPSTSFSDSLVFDFNGEQIDCRFFGPGHSFDNITVWMPNSKMLFGGCLVKSNNSTGLGNLSDAVVDEWDFTVQKLIEKYKDIKVVIPGHGNWGGKELLNRTVELVKNAKKSDR